MTMVNCGGERFGREFARCWAIRLRSADSACGFKPGLVRPKGHQRCMGSAAFMLMPESLGLGFVGIHMSDPSGLIWNRGGMIATKILDKPPTPKEVPTIFGSPLKCSCQSL